MDEFLKKTIAELTKAVADKREALRVWRFGITGSKVKNMKEGRAMRKEIALMLTAIQIQNAKSKAQK